MTERAEQRGLRLTRLSGGFAAAGCSRPMSNDISINDISLSVDPDQILALVGPSGGGKTSLLLAIAGLMPLRSGTIEFGQSRLDLLPPHRRSVAMMFQSNSLLPHQSLWQNIEGAISRSFIGSLAGGKKEALALARDFAESAGLKDCLDRRSENVSGGQQRRAELIRSMASGHPLRLLDEPLTGLDRSLARKMMRWIQQWHQRIGGVTICVTHDFAAAMQISDRVAVIDCGRVTQCDGAERLAKEPNHLVVARNCCLAPQQELGVEFICRRPVWVDHIECDGGRATRVLFDWRACHPPTSGSTTGHSSNNAAADVQPADGAVQIDVVRVRSLGLSVFELTAHSSDGQEDTIVVQCQSPENVTTGRWTVRVEDQRWFGDDGKRVRA